MRGVSGAALSGEVDRYCLRLGVTKAAFSRASGIASQTLSGLLRVQAVRPQTAAVIRDFIGDNPDRLPDTPVPKRTLSMAQPKANAAAPAGAPPFQATRAELILTELVKTPNDLVRHVAGRWPEVWQAVLLRARAEEKVPGAVLLAAIEGGLGIEVTCG
jgi:hypothetical protein